MDRAHLEFGESAEWIEESCFESWRVETSDWTRLRDPFTIRNSAPTVGLRLDVQNSDDSYNR